MLGSPFSYQYHVPLGEGLLGNRTGENPVIQFLCIDCIRTTLYQGHAGQFVSGSFRRSGDYDWGTSCLELDLVVCIADSNRDFTGCNALARSTSALGVLVDVLVQFLHVLNHLVLSSKNIESGGQGVVCSTGGVGVCHADISLVLRLEKISPAL